MDTPIDPQTTRDQILFGDPNQECTGIVVTCWANVYVIQAAIEKQANLIICHESLFWNHGDHTTWLEDTNNGVYLQKVELLRKHNLVVWRNHDYIHSGIQTKTGYTDEIFYGLANQMGWDIGNQLGFPMTFSIPTIPLTDLVDRFLTKLPIHGARVVGNMNTQVKKNCIGFHILGIPQDNQLIAYIEEEGIDLVLTGENVDYTVNEYIYDAGLLHKNMALLTVGHFNIEEPGMKYMAEHMPDTLQMIPCHFVSSKDMYQYRNHTKKRMND